MYSSILLFAYLADNAETENLSSSDGHSAESGKSFHWNYQEYGPDVWARTIEKCHGKKQSPINVETNDVEYDINLKPFSFLHYDANLNWNITHTGHTGRSLFICFILT